jgi:beta-phosphoglucomutase-like phosphatase (HAD superfamily)
MADDGTLSPPCPLTDNPVGRSANSKIATEDLRVRYQGIVFDFNGVLFCDADLQVKSWQVIAKNLRGQEMTDGVRPGKPAPDVYLAAARNIGIVPSECVVVEDAVSGLAAAYAAGIGYIVAIGARAEFPRLLACDGVAVAIESLRDFPREQLLDQP